MREISLPSRSGRWFAALSPWLLALALGACSGGSGQGAATADAAAEGSATATHEPAKQSGFVQVQGTHFVLDG